MARWLVALSVMLAAALVVQTVRLHTLQRHCEDTANLTDSENDDQEARTRPERIGEMLVPTSSDQTDKPEPAVPSLSDRVRDRLRTPTRRDDSPDPAAGVEQAAAPGAYGGQDSYGEAADGPQAGEALSRQVVLQRARDLMDRGDYQGALLELDQALAANPDNYQAYLTLASLYQKMGDPERELQTYEQLVQQVPGEAMGRYYLAQAYARQGMTDRALEQTRFFENQTANDLDKVAVTASLYRNLGMFDEEGRVLASWLEAAPQSPDAHRALAGYYQRAGDPVNALAGYQRVVELTPGSVSARQNLASAYTSFGYHEQAVDELATAAQMHPGDLNVQLQLADACERAQYYEDAEQTYEYVIQQAPQSQQAQHASRALERVMRRLDFVQ